MRGSSSLVGGSESMTNPIVVSKHARFWIPYRNRDFLDTTRPFIGEIAGRVAKTGDLEDSVLRAAERSPAAVPYFAIEPGRILETFALRDEFFFADAQPRSLFIERGRNQYEIPFSRDFSVATRELCNMNTVISLSASGLYDAEAIRTRLNGDAVVLFDFLLNNGLLTSESRNLFGFAPARCSGVYRLQHASLLYRTPTTGVLVDPHLHSTYGSITDDVHKDHLNSKVDAILISHFHEDHWFLATLLMFDRDTPIVVPKVPRSTIICGDMAEILRRCGFRNVIAVDWYATPLQFGDIEVHVLPFYGEQPLRYQEPKDQNIRNWGNTYVVRTEQYTSWFLIDSGADAQGSMSGVAHQVRERIGKVDVVLSNLRRFPPYSPFFINDGANWLTLSPRQMP